MYSGNVYMPGLHVEVCGLVDRALNSKLKGFEFDSQCWSRSEVSGKLFVLYCLCIPSSDGYLVDENCSILPGEIKLFKWYVSCFQEG